MATSYSTSGVQHLLFFPFRTRGWFVKLLIGGLMMIGSMFIGLAGGAIVAVTASFGKDASIVPIVFAFIIWIASIFPSLVLFGYGMKIMDQVFTGAASLSMPDWTDWGQMLKDGWRFFITFFLATLPALILILIAYGSILYTQISMLKMTEWTDLQDFANPNFFNNFYNLTQNGTMAMGQITGTLLMLVGSLIMFVLYFFLPPALAHVTAEKRFAALFDIKGWWKCFTANLGGFVLCDFLILGAFVGFVYLQQMMIITIVGCCLIPVLYILVYPYMLIVMQAMFAAAYMEGKQKAQEKAASAPQPEVPSLPMMQ